MEMTRKEFIQEYGNELVSFESYSKYIFFYSSALPDGKKIVVEVGGCAEDIYRLSVSCGEESTVSSLEICAGIVLDGDHLIRYFNEN